MTETQGPRKFSDAAVDHISELVSIANVSHHDLWGMEGVRTRVGELVREGLQEQEGARLVAHAERFRKVKHDAREGVRALLGSMMERGVGPHIIGRIEDAFDTLTFSEGMFNEEATVDCYLAALRAELETYVPRRVLDSLDGSIDPDEEEMGSTEKSVEKII